MLNKSFFNHLLSIIDTGIIGHLNSLSYIGTIVTGGMIFNVIYWSFGFLRMRTTGKTAQTFGRGVLNILKHKLYYQEFVRI